MSDAVLDQINSVLERLGSMGVSDLQLTSNRGAYAVKDKQTLAINDFGHDPEVMLNALVDDVEEGQLKLKTSKQLGASFDRGGSFRGRVAIAMEEQGISGTIRLISRDIPTVKKLGLPTGVVGMSERPAGLVLVVGQTGSGKSTTIAAMNNRLNESTSVGIYTLESPIEYLYPQGKSLVVQREVGVHVESFERGIEDAKRRHPRIIMVGEILNAATARAALLAATSGHLVVSTMHAGTTAEAIDSFISYFTPEEQGLVRTQLAQSLVGIVAQQLIPKQGQAGGMALAQEIAFNTREFSELVRGGTDRSAQTKFIRTMLLTPASEQRGMTSMEGSIARLTKEGAISMSTAFTYARDRKDLEQKFKEIGVRVPAELLA